MLGVDVGSTGVKAVAFAVDSTWRHVVIREYPMLQPAPRWQVQDPDVLLAATHQAMSACMAAAGDAEVVAILMSSAMHGLIGLDAAKNTDNDGAPAVRKGRPPHRHSLWYTGCRRGRRRTTGQRRCRSDRRDRPSPPSTTTCEPEHRSWTRPRNRRGNPRPTPARPPEKWSSPEVKARRFASPADGTHRLRSSSDAEARRSPQVDLGAIYLNTRRDPRPAPRARHSASTINRVCQR
ncbi:FGGY family carbohydrate kinase [Phytohabitans kaempferiae]|uniref:FGGY family carbohydrate kinase n=1 Tax=Phytohabitans kaempferiae TaxID=1620943 RepID=A0ABV6M3B9_9ACTN